MAVCQLCECAPALGQYCPACYGKVLHPEGLPLVPGDPGDPWRAFNAEADTYMADVKMGRFAGFVAEWNAYVRAVGRNHDHDIPFGDDTAAGVGRLSAAQVRAGARPGETWGQARRRLEALGEVGPPVSIDDHPGADYTLAGPIDECEGLDGQPIDWQPGELGACYHE